MLYLCFICLSTDYYILATTHILPVSSPENALLQQQKPTSSTQTSQQQQMTGSSLMNQANNSQNSQSNQQSQEQNYFTTSNDTQLTDTQQMTSVASATSPVQMPQNGYATSINSNAQSTQSFTQQQCIGGAQAAAWTARGSNTLTYTQSMQPPDARTLNQQYCEISLKYLYQRRVYVNFSRATNAS